LETLTNSCEGDVEKGLGMARNPTIISVT
jgi:hypothetical protein